MLFKKKEILDLVLKYLPSHISNPFFSLDCSLTEKLCEIRLKTGLPVVLVFTDRTSFITVTGRLTEYISNDLVRTSDSDINDIFVKMCNYSVYSLTESISEGYITLENGCRVGVYGTAVMKNGRIYSVRNIRGLNIRLSGQYDSVSGRISDLYIERNVNTLICGPPSSGKTTMLKDLCRVLSDKYRRRIALIDERGEFQCSELGFNTDVLTSYPKAKGVNIAVRTLSPEIVICDELGDSEEVQAVLDGLNSGVNFIMTLHCSSYSELQNKEQFKRLSLNSFPDYCVFLKNKCEIERIVSLKVERDENDCCDYVSGCNGTDWAVLRT